MYPKFSFKFWFFELEIVKAFFNTSQNRIFEDFEKWLQNLKSENKTGRGIKGIYKDNISKFDQHWCRIQLTA